MRWQKKKKEKRSFKPIPVRDGAGKIVAALVSSNDPGECYHHFSAGKTGVQPENEPWYYKVEPPEL